MRNLPLYLIIAAALLFLLALMKQGRDSGDKLKQRRQNASHWCNPNRLLRGSIYPMSMVYKT